MTSLPNDILEHCRALCECGHNRAVHHHDMGCLALLRGELCRCSGFEEIVL
jgi:hypothetical protein